LKSSIQKSNPGPTKDSRHLQLSCMVSALKKIEELILKLKTDQLVFREGILLLYGQRKQCSNRSHNTYQWRKQVFLLNFVLPTVGGMSEILANIRVLSSPTSVPFATRSDPPKEISFIVPKTIPSP